MAARHREETDLELERLLSSKLQAEQLLEMRERSHRQNVKHLEEQVLAPSSILLLILFLLMQTKSYHINILPHLCYYYLKLPFISSSLRFQT